MKVNLFTDGGLVGSNPGIMTYGFVIKHAKPRAGKLHIGHGATSVGTSNQSEYQALIKGMASAKLLGATKISVFVDSQVICHQMSGRYACKTASLRPWHKKATRLASTFGHFEITWIPREDNREADELGRMAGRLWKMKEEMQDEREAKAQAAVHPA